VQDYASMGHTLRTHPVALLRPKLNPRRIVSAGALSNLPHGRLVRVSGLVTCRQRPGTAKGVLFVTLEDESGNANVVVWSRVFEAQRSTILAARLMTVYGKLERSGAVVHVVAQRVVDDSALLGGLSATSRDFH
jgi:error-prone DNA polymerase